MADEEKAKAEKLAAAKKRFEQLKKEQAKKSKKAAPKKQDDKASTTDTKVADDANEANTNAGPGEDEGAIDNDGQSEDAQADGDDSSRPHSERLPSVSQRSKERSESFRQGSGVTSPVSADFRSGSGPISASAEVQELYKKQASRIEELEKENAAFRLQQEESAIRLAKVEEELESLREGSSDLIQLRSKAKDAERLSSELAAVQRQLAQAQHAAKGSGRRVSGASPDLTHELASRTSTIEALEMELSNLRNQLLGIQHNLSDRETSIKDLEERAKAAETATESYRQELDQLKLSMSFPSDETQAANEDPEKLTKRISILESDLRTAQSSLDAAQQRAKSLEQKVETLTKLHRDATTTNLHKDKELSELRTQLRRRDRPSHVRDASDFELGEEETESGALQARIRALEAENFDLRRGVWRDKRAEMQPGIEDYSSAGPEYEDVDLNAGPYSPRLRGQRGSIPRQTSTFQDVITSGISAFTGRPREPLQRGMPENSEQQRNRAQSLGLLSDDDGFDEDAFRLAQEEEAKRRVERVKEVKRGLDKWKGWRVDLVELRQQAALGGRELGPVFEV